MKSFILATILSASFSLSAYAEPLIGVAGPTKGPFAPFTEQISAGVEAAVQKWNTEKGTSFTVETIDDECKADRGEAVANQFVGKNAIAIIGHVCDRPSIIASRIYSQNEIVQISPISQNEKLTSNQPNEQGGIFRFAAIESDQWQVLGAFLSSEFGDKQLAILNDGSVYANALIDGVKEILSQNGLSPIREEEFEPGQDDYRALAARLVDSGAEVVLFGGFALDAITLQNNLTTLDSNLTFVGGDAFANQEFAKTEYKGEIYLAFPKPLDSVSQKENTSEKEKAPRSNTYMAAYAAAETFLQATGTGQTYNEIRDVLKNKTFDTSVGQNVKYETTGDIEFDFYMVHQWQQNTIRPLSNIEAENTSN